jgi:hypothetical protein
MQNQLHMSPEDIDAVFGCHFLFIMRLRGSASDAEIHALAEDILARVHSQKVALN